MAIIFINYLDVSCLLLLAFSSSIHDDTPNQPRSCQFPRSGPKGHERSFQSVWFDRFLWLHYNEIDDSAFCFLCVKAAESNSLSTQALSQGDAFLKQGYQNWKKATEKAKGFQKHETSKTHLEAVARYVQPKSGQQPNVVDMISTEAAMTRFRNRQMLLKILTNVRYLGKNF